MLQPNASDTQIKDQEKERKKMAIIVPFKNGDIGFPFEKLEVEPIPLGGGTRVEVQLADVPLEHLRLDQTNPRLRYKLEARRTRNPKHEELVELLWADDDVKRLKRSIQTMGGLIEAIIINGADGTVLEGNCRTACYTKLAKEFPDDEKWKKLRARIVPPGVDRDKINILLGELHIAGKNEWSAFEQAAHLYNMNERGFAEAELAETYRLSKSSVNKKIRAFKLMSEKYLPQTSGDASLLEKWSYFEEFYKKCNPKNNEDGMALEEDFVRWMLEDKFKRGEQVRLLPAILDNPEARKVLEKKDIESAWEIVQQGSPELGSKLFKAIVTATEALEEAPLSEVNEIKNGDEVRWNKVQDLFKALNTFVKQTGRKL